MLPIPSRFTFGLKPADMCITMGKAWKPDFKGIINFTVTPTLFGDCYANLGMFGVLLGAFWSLVATIMDAICNRRHEIFSLLFWGMIATVFVDIGRGSIYNPLCLIFYGSILIIMYKTVARIKIGIRFGSLRQSRRLKI